MDVLLDPVTNRYKLFVPSINTFSYRYLRLFFPNDESNIITDEDYFRIGTTMFFDTRYEMQQNPFFPYEIKALDAVNITEFEGGSDTRVKVGELVWHGGFEFRAYEEADLDDLIILTRIKRGDHMVFYQNLGRTYEAYLCRKVDNIGVEYDGGLDKYSTEKLLLKEVY
jgi:hypothetical protein